MTMLAFLLDLGYSPEALNDLADFILELRRRKTAVEPTPTNKRETTAVVTHSSEESDRQPRFLESDEESVYTLSRSLFGDGFTRSQVRRLLAVCRYKRIPVHALEGLMIRLRCESWARGWVRTRDALESLPAAA